MPEQTKTPQPRCLIEDRDGFLLSLTEPQFQAYRQNQGKAIGESQNTR